MRKLLGAFTLASSVLLAVICVAAVQWYLFDVLIGLRGEPDRSMQFWGLAIVYIGIWAGGAAVGLAVHSRKLLTRNDPAHTNPHGQRLGGQSPSRRGDTAR